MMKRQPGNRNKMALVLMVLFLATLACSIFPSSAAVKTPTKVVKKTMLATRVVNPTRAVEVAPTDEPAATEAPIMDEPTAEPVVAGPSESWRVTPMKGAQLVAFDQTPNLSPEWRTTMDKQARNLAIPKPYYFEIYDLPKQAKYVDVRDYYNDQITQNAMKKALDFVGDNGVGAVSWVGTIVHNRKYLVQYIPGDSQYVPMMFIIYSNPE
jgi:hypothetical protein